MENMWPDINDINTTEEVMPFFESTIATLKDNYEGKIQAQICPIEYILKNMRNTLSIISDITKLVGPQEITDEYEEKIDIEKDRQQVYIENHDYKYEIYNDHLYYKLFTVNIPEFYPIKIHVAAGILKDDDIEKDISSIEELKSVFSNIVCSNKVRMIIKKMIK